MKFLRRTDPYAFAVTMVGIKMGDRLLQLGCGDGKLLAALALKVGLTGRACGVDTSDEGVERARAAAAQEGALVELQRAPYAMLPFDAAAFDLIVLHDMLRGLAPQPRVMAIGESARVLRPSGRCLVVDRAERGGLGALIGGPRPDPTYQPAELLRTGGFRAVRLLADREGFSFVEGLKTGVA
jgi:ubiquinone/menaquinone biosynthesis C-methylase UbiE